MTTTLRIEGTGTQRGEAHGEQLRELIAEAARRWHADAGSAAEDQLVALVDRSGFRTTAERYAPDLVNEIDGIARGSAVDGRTIWALNLLDEDWWIRDHRARGEACSTFGVEPGLNQPAVIAQNMDLPEWLDGLQILLDVRPDQGPRVLAPSYAGMIATNALNEVGIGVCLNTLPDAPTSSSGLPVSIMMRKLATQTTFEAAVELLARTPHASGQNYLIGSPDAVADFECGAGIVASFPPSHGRVAHTNHRVTGGAPSSGRGAMANSLTRLLALQERLRPPPIIGLEEATAILRDPPLCRGTDGDTGFTFYSVVMELSASPALHLTDGPPDHHDYMKYGFERVMR